MENLRWGRVRVSVHLLADLLAGNWSRFCKETNAPKDLKVIGVEQPAYGIGAWFYVICESKDFDPVQEGAEIPEKGPFDYETVSAI